jgi:hypothetical protein
MHFMNRLPPELSRLYGLGSNALDSPASDVETACLQRGVRAVVLEIALPAGWEQLSTVWKGVQSDLDLSAPAIAVSGVDGLQLWFSFAAAVSSSFGSRFLQGLRGRYLKGLGSTHVRMFSEAAGLPAAPFAEMSPQRWSAFVTPDLASVFAETPWLDIPPTDEGQATILRALEPIPQIALEAALKKLGATEDDGYPEPIDAKRTASIAARGSGHGHTDPARFLAGVMNDETAPLALRIEAAKILLSHTRGSPTATGQEGLI